MPGQKRGIVPEMVWGEDRDAENPFQRIDFLGGSIICTDQEHPQLEATDIGCAFAAIADWEIGEISESLGITIAAVTKHQQKIREALDVHNRSGLLKTCLENKLIQMRSGDIGMLDKPFSLQDLDLIEQIAQGKTNGQIGREHGLSVDRIKQRVGETGNHVGVFGRQRLVIAAMITESLTRDAWVPNPLPAYIQASTDQLFSPFALRRIFPAPQVEPERHRERSRTS